MNKKRKLFLNTGLCCNKLVNMNINSKTRVEQDRNWLLYAKHGLRWWYLPIKIGYYREVCDIFSQSESKEPALLWKDPRLETDPALPGGTPITES